MGRQGEPASPALREAALRELQRRIADAKDGSSSESERPRDARFAWTNAEKWVSDYSTDTTPLRSPTARTSAPTPTSATSTYTRSTLPNHLRPSDELVAQVNVLQREVDALKDKLRLAQQDHGETKSRLSTKTQELVRQSPSPTHHIPTAR
jgi:hypothetical protein